MAIATAESVFTVGFLPASMSADRALLDEALERGEEEGGNVEFKERLTRAVHLSDGRMESLAAQLRHRVLSGDGVATYVVGVTDDGGIAGIPPATSPRRWTCFACWPKRPARTSRRSRRGA